jgi:hypothetical protein
LEEELVPMGGGLSGGVERALGSGGA